MQAMILAAGRGERLRPLTDHCPKPMLQVGAYRLIEYAIQRLHRAGFTELVINTAWLAGQISSHLGDGQRYGVHITYSPETAGALETAGGIINALPLLQSHRFVVINADVYCDYPLEKLRTVDSPAHIVLVNNPRHHPGGDYQLDASGHVHGKDETSPTFTFSGTGVYDRQVFEGYPVKPFPMRQVFRDAIENRVLTGETYLGTWIDVGDPSRLQQLRDLLQTGSN